MRERVLTSKRVFQGRVLSLRVDEVEAADGHRGLREVVEHPGAVGVVAVHLGQVVLVRQYRHATGEVLLEIPAGKLTPGEDPAACAARELVEEVGLRPRSLERLAVFYTTPGFSDERFHLFYADDLVEDSAELEAGEVLEVERVPVEEVRRLVLSGTVRDAKTLVGLGLLLIRGLPDPPAP